MQNTRHYAFWPKRVPKSLTVPETTLYENLEMTARKFPMKTAFHYYGKSYSYSKFKAEVDAVAGFLQDQLGVVKGEKILLFMQNSPQFLISYYGILRAEAVVVPINPMNTLDELTFYIKDCEIQHSFVGQELYDRVAPLQGTTSLKNMIVCAYSDYADDANAVGDLPAEVREPQKMFPNSIRWEDVIQAGYKPGSYDGKATDPVVLPYTSGTTGLPKGCIHTNQTVQANIIGTTHWLNMSADIVTLQTMPLFHVTGMLHSMHLPIYIGGAMVIMTRWDRQYAVKAIEAYQCTHWINITTMLIDFLANPQISEYDISSLMVIAGGGAALPEAVGEHLYKLTGLEFVEAYGLSETISHTHFNPADRPKLQCLGVPAFDVDARVIDPATLQLVGVNEPGEIIVNGPQVFKGYYNREDENRSSFIEIDGKMFFRTGDIGRVDEDGYFFMVDRVKRMINASGFKVWPTEVESLLYKHPAIQQACVVGVPDPRRGETVKAFVILKEGVEGTVSEAEIIEWSKEHMAAYKYPRIIEFRKTFPTTSSGKILWRKLQEEEAEKQVN